MKLPGDPASGDNEMASTERTRALRPIGVFDSGIGGLTVVSALRQLLPAENIVYIGDNARYPYGTKSAQTIERYSCELAGLLLAEGAKMIVVACNTASALGLPRLQETLRVPAIGVITSGAAAAVEATQNKRVGLIGTRGTIASGAYERALYKLNSKLQVHALPCPLLVPLVEEGLLEDFITDQVIIRYLQPLLAEGIDTLILGCTHYPLLLPALVRHVGPNVRLVDSAHHCAAAAKTLLEDAGLSAPEDNLGTLRVALTDASDSFLRVAERALHLQVGDVQLRSVQGVAWAQG